MRHTFFSFFFLFSFSLFAQNDYEYFGAIKLNDTSVISYKVLFQEKMGVITGYSITDLGGKHETKSELSGAYDAKNKILKLNEKGIVYTKSPITQDDFCFIHFTSKKFSLGRSKLLEGTFEGLFSDRTKCIDGSIKMTAIDKIVKRTKKITKKIISSKRINDSIKQRVNPIKLFDSLNMNILRKNETLSVFAKSKTLSLVIYDGGKEDGDRISLYLDNKIVLNNYEIKNTKKIIPLTIVGKKLNLKIVALNNGSIAQNTVVLKLLEKGREIDILSSLKKGESSQIEFLIK